MFYTIVYIDKRFVIVDELETATAFLNAPNFLEVASQISNPIGVSSKAAQPNTFKNGNPNKAVLDMNQPILVIVTEKTDSLMLTIQNYEDVELVLATELNVVSLLEAAQCIVS